jgi:hypothetical protein
MTWLSALWSLIKKLLELFRRKQEEPEPAEQYTKEQFIDAVRELSNDAVWRARILRDALNKLREQKTFETKWVSKDEITEQVMHRGFGCGLSFRLVMVYMR